MAKPGEVRYDDEGNDKTWEDDDVTAYWLEHYVGSDTLCILCKNRGRVDLAYTGYTVKGDLIEKPFCICPNGQVLRWHKNRGN